MASYFYKWIPLFIIGTLFLLGLPWLGLIALIFVLFTFVSALVALAFAVSRAVGNLGRALGQRPAQPPPTGA
jgi:hypothetical protein